MRIGSGRRGRKPRSRCIVPPFRIGGPRMRLLLNWVLSALAVWIVSQVVPGISVSDPVTALIAALVIGLVNATIRLLLKILTFPLTLLTLGLFCFVINALMLELASLLVRGLVVL